MKQSITFAFLLSLLLILGTANASMFSIDITGLPIPSGIESVTIELQLSDNFSYTEGSLQLGDAIPFVPSTDLNLFPWTFAPPSPSSGTFTVDVYNSDAFDGSFPDGFNKDSKYEENNLLNGTIATFEYSAGEILGVKYFFAGDAKGDRIGYPILYTLQSDPDTGNGALHLSAVPIPATALLFLSGILGLVGVRRKLFR